MAGELLGLERQFMTAARLAMIIVSLDPVAASDGGDEFLRRKRRPQLAFATRAGSALLVRRRQAAVHRCRRPIHRPSRPSM